MNAKDFEIEFYAAMANWVVGGKQGPDPRGEWECLHVGQWMCGHKGPPGFVANTTYRWKPDPRRTVTIDGVVLVAPETDAPEPHTYYFFEGWTGDVFKDAWRSTEGDNQALKNGKVFLTREDAQAMSDVLRKQRGCV